MALSFTILSAPSASAGDAAISQQHPVQQGAAARVPVPLHHPWLSSSRPAIQCPDIDLPISAFSVAVRDGKP